MDVSIIIINYNSIEYTKKCIKSVLQFSDSFSYEIILIDNGSENFNREEIVWLFGNIKIFENAVNQGFARAVNQGIRVSGGEFILLLNNDTKLKENSILKCLNILKKNKNLGFISPRVIHEDGSIQHVANSFPGIIKELIELFRINRFLSKKQLSDIFAGRFFDHRTNRVTDWVWGTFLMFPGNLVNIFKDHRLPEEYFMYYEDLQWCYQAKKAGYLTYYYADTEIIHYLSRSLNDKSERKESMIMENEKKFIKAEKGSLYFIIYFVVKGAVFLTQKDKHLRMLGIRYLKQAFN